MTWQLLVVLLFGILVVGLVVHRIVAAVENTRIAYHTRLAPRTDPHVTQEAAEQVRKTRSDP